MTHGGEIRRAKAMLRELCKREGHKMTGDKQRYCEVCAEREVK